MTDAGADAVFIPEGSYLSRGAAARALGISGDSVGGAKRRGALPAAVEGPGITLWRAEDVEAYRLYRDGWLRSIGRKVPEPVS